MSSHAIYGLLGQISVTFATVEHRLINLLEYLLTKDNCSLVKPYILDDLSLSRCIQKIQAVSKLRLWDQTVLLDELLAVISAIDNLRIQRNLFIHGDWFTEDLTEYATSVTVLDYKPRLDKETGVWQYLESVRASDTKLKTMLNEIDNAFHELNTVYNKICKVELR